MTLDSLKHSFKGLLKKKPKVMHRKDPHGDWNKLLLFFFIASLAVIAVDGYLFYKINRGEIFILEKDDFVKNDTIDRAKLERLNAHYNGQATALYERTVNEPDVIDPSL